MQVELDYVTVIYTCGCAGARAVRRPRGSDLIYSNVECKNCQNAAPVQTETAPLGDYFIVDGHKMLISQRGVYWIGGRYEHSKKITKYFGKVDPRPGLQEAY